MTIFPNLVGDNQKNQKAQDFLRRGLKALIDRQSKAVTTELALPIVQLFIILQ